MMDLNSLVDLPAGVILQIAYGINNAGQVIAVGTFPSLRATPFFLPAWPLSVSSRGERRWVGKLLAWGRLAVEVKARFTL